MILAKELLQELYYNINSKYLIHSLSKHPSMDGMMMTKTQIIHLNNMILDKLGSH